MTLFEEDQGTEDLCQVFSMMKSEAGVKEVLVIFEERIEFFAARSTAS